MAGSLARSKIGIPSVQSGQVRIKQKGNGRGTEGGEEMICLGMPKGAGAASLVNRRIRGPPPLPVALAVHLTRIFSGPLERVTG